MYNHPGSVIETIEASNGKSRVEIVFRDDGLYEFREHNEVTVDETKWGAGVITYEQSSTSGLYMTMELAKADAFRLVLWLRDRI